MHIVNTKSLVNVCDMFYNFNMKTSDVSGVYNIKSGDVTHVLVLLQDGRLVIDGKFAQSTIYRQGVGPAYSFKVLFIFKYPWLDVIFNNDS